MSERISALSNAAARAAYLSERVNWAVERACAALLVLLVMDVWLGVLVRYVIPLPITFTEEAARYLMIWTALLAVSSGIARRDHIGVQLLVERLPVSARRMVLLLIDVLALAFFLFLMIYGIGLVEKGLTRFTMIFGVTKALPFAAVPVSAALASVQLMLVAVRDQAAFEDRLA